MFSTEARRKRRPYMRSPNPSFSSVAYRENRIKLHFIASSTITVRPVNFAVHRALFTRSLFVIALAGLAWVPAQARLGETLDQLKARLGKPEQQAQPRKDTAIWLFEVEDGQLIYNVTLDTHGRSIAEGLRPLKRAAFTKDTAQDFIQAQIAPFRDSKTLHTFTPGEKYKFAGETFTCAEGELAIVDDVNGVMIVWTQKGVPSVMAVSAVMVQQTH